VTRICGYHRAIRFLQVAVDAHALGSLPLLLRRGANANAADQQGTARSGSLQLATNSPSSTHCSAPASRPTLAPRRTDTAARSASCDAPDIAQALLAAGASLEATDAQGHTPLMLAVRRGSGTRQGTARTPGEDRCHRSRTPHGVVVCSRAGSRDEVVLLLAAGANSEVADVRGLTILHAAAAQAASDVSAALGSDPHLNRRDDLGDTPLLIAAATGHADVVQALLTRSRPGCQNNAGDTALIVASRGATPASVICCWRLGQTRRCATVPA